jgi:antitoxin CptB
MLRGYDYNTASSRVIFHPHCQSLLLIAPYHATSHHFSRLWDKTIEGPMEYNRLMWASRRGMLELDLVLQPFLENHYQGLPQADKERFWQLLEAEDQDLFVWFMRRADPEDPELLKIVQVIRDHTGLQPQS